MMHFGRIIAGPALRPAPRLHARWRIAILVALGPVGWGSVALLLALLL
ncbi:hypothetical protein [Sphingomonas carotinifaciens]|nr:hypothetical protein [Sphingomonas carotinifaciens]